MGYVDAWVNLGVTFESEGDLDRRAHAYESAVAPGDRAANWQLAELLVRLDADPATVEPAPTARRSTAGEDRALLGLGLVLHGEGRSPRPSRSCARAVERDVEAPTPRSACCSRRASLRGEAETHLPRGPGARRWRAPPSTSATC